MRASPQALARRLGSVTVTTDRLQVFVAVGPASCLRDDMVNGSCRRHAAASQAGLTKASVAEQDAHSDPLPSASVSPCMAIAANGIWLPLDGLVSVLIAVRLAVRDEYPTAAVLTGLHWPSWHIEPHYRCIEQIKEPARFSPCGLLQSYGWSGYLLCSTSVISVMLLNRLTHSTP